MSKPYHQMTDMERTAARIQANKAIEQRIQPVLDAQRRAQRAAANRAVRRAATALHRALFEATGVGLPMDLVVKLEDATRD